MQIGIGGDLLVEVWEPHVLRLSDHVAIVIVSVKRGFCQRTVGLHNSLGHRCQEFPSLDESRGLALYLLVLFRDAELVLPINACCFVDIPQIESRGLCAVIQF